MGHCCQGFVITTHTYAEMRDLWFAHLDGKAPEGDRSDIAFIWPMLQLEEEGANGYGRFSCKHFDTRTGNCTQYERRPSMCRDFGVLAPCGFQACEWVGARQRDWDLAEHLEMVGAD